MEHSSDVILEVSGYSGGFVSSNKVFTPFLDNVSFSLRKHALTAIVGETGSGKSLMALSMLALPPQSFRRTAGSILFNGIDLTRADGKTLRSIRGSRISFACQDAHAALNPVITVGRQISDVCRIHQRLSKRAAMQKTEEILKHMRVPEQRTRMAQYPHEFSGGMAQRAMIAMALVCQPEILVLDEPTTGLDVTIQADIIDMIVDLVRREGLTVCLITHDLGIVAESCDDVVVLRHGRVVETGSCQQIMTEPRQSYTRELIAVSGPSEGVT